MSSARFDTGPAKAVRTPRVREPAYLGWVAGLPCVACMAVKGVANWEVQVAHVRFADSAAGWEGTGMAEKPSDRRTAPLCADHHTDGPEAQHGMGEREFWEGLGVDPTKLCAELSASFDQGRTGLPVIALYAGRAWKARGSPNVVPGRA